MTSSSMPEQEHRRSSPPETVTMASDEPQPQLPGLGDPTTERSAASMVTDGSSGDEEEVIRAQGRPLGDFVLIGTPCGKLLLSPTPLASMKQDEEVSAPLHRLENMPAAANGGKKQCVECGATETPQWRMQPIGLGALCNACRIRLRPAEALREPVHVHLPPPATARARARTPEPAPAPEEKTQKRKRKPRHPQKSSKPRHHCKSASTPHPQWRMGPTGPSTPCNAYGVGYRQGQGRLLEEYRPAASPNLKPSEHACKHHEVLQPCQKKHKGKEQQHQPPQPAAMQLRAGDGMEQHLPPPPAQARAAAELPTGEPISLDQLLLDAAIDGSRKTHIVYGVGGDLQMGDPSSLDQFLFNGPAAPPLIDDDDDEEDLAD